MLCAIEQDGEGAIVAAMSALCEATGRQSWCNEADQRARDDIKWLAPFADGPQYDSVLIRGLLALYGQNHDARLYDFARSRAPFPLSGSEAAAPAASAGTTGSRGSENSATPAAS
jgi:hypothetical protein